MLVFLQTCFCWSVLEFFFRFKSLHLQFHQLNNNVGFISLTEAIVVDAQRPDSDYSFPVWPTWPYMTPALLEGKSPGTTAPWTWRGGIGWAVRSPACPCPAPAPRRRVTLWKTSASASDSPVIWSETPLVANRKLWLWNILYALGSRLFFLLTPRQWIVQFIECVFLLNV